MAKNKELKQKPKKKSKKKKLFMIIFVEVLLLLLFVSIFWIYNTLDQLNYVKMDLQNIKMNSFQDENIDEYTNIAFFGVDSRANELEKQTRSDSIMVVSIHKKTKEVKVVSVYRDTYVNIENKGYTKINHAYAYGGPELAISTLNKNLDLNINNFVTVNFSALTNIVDALGGIILDIKEDELKYVNDYTRDVAKVNGTSYKYLKAPGEQVVDGTQATAYCRVRYTAGGDFTRAERQRTVLQAIVNKAKDTNPITLLKLVNQVLPQVYTSLDTKELLSLGKSLFSYHIAGQDGFPFDKKPKMIQGASVVVPLTLSSNVTKLHEYLFGTKDYKPSDTVNSYSNVIKTR